MSSTQQANTSRSFSTEAFAFVQALAKEMTDGKIRIPQFPDLAVRLRRILADENSDTARIAKVASADPAMVAQLLQIANSVAFNVSGTRITQLNSAIARIGISNVRTASLVYAMAQLRNAPSLQPIRKPLSELWQRNVKVAAMSMVIARRWTCVNPDKALLAGLMHGMGRVYILTRAVNHPALFADVECYQQIVRDWNIPIAKAVLESWDIAPDIVKAVEHHEKVDRPGAGSPDLTDVLNIANLLVSFHADPAVLDIHLHETTASKRMGLTPQTCRSVLKEAAGELASLRQALGG